MSAAETIETQGDCVCVFPDDGIERWARNDYDIPDQCLEFGPNAVVCTRPPGHDGQHVACNTWPQHRIEEWPQEADDG